MGLTSFGDNGSGLGYSGIKNSLAIEFDSKYSYDKNDPETSEGRHLSVIVDTDNTGDEVRSIGWNDSPINYNQQDK